MLQECRNIYQIARESTGITQEKASELLDVSVESIRAYELDKRIPPNAIVIKMIEIYDSRYLAYQHLKKSSNEVIRTVVPQIELKSLPIAILSLANEIKDMINIKDELINIGADGVISEDEKEQWDNIIEKLDKITGIILSLKFIK